MSESDNVEVHELEEAAARAQEQAEEQRVAAIELRMLLDASEARLRALTAEVEDARSGAIEAERAREAARVEAIEMRVILDATEHRADNLQHDLERLQRDHGITKDQFIAELNQAVGERKVLDEFLREARSRLEKGDRAIEEMRVLSADFEAQRRSLEESEERVARLSQELTLTRDSSVEMESRLNGLLEKQEGLERRHAELSSLAEAGEEAQRHREENCHLRQRVEELELSQADAAQRHSSAVSKYMLELNQRSEDLRQTQEESTAAKEELELTRQMCNDTASELTALRLENEALLRRAKDLESRLARLKLEGFRPGGSGSRVETISVDESVDGLVTDLEGQHLKAQLLTVVHLEDRPEYREALKSTVSQFPRMEHQATSKIPPAPPPGPSLLVVNLLVGGLDALAAIGAADRWGLSDPTVFVYCADSGRGVVLGLVDYFPEPFDVDACATRLLERDSATQRLLVVSDNIELMNTIRSTMSRFHCSTSGALDARQAFELATLVRPDFALIDLALQRGEGLRLLARLRSDPKTAALPAAFLCGRKIDASDLRAYAARVARDTPLDVEEFKRATQQALTDRGFRRELLRETA